jgi:hypothetical protein
VNLQGFVIQMPVLGINNSLVEPERACSRRAEYLSLLDGSIKMDTIRFKNSYCDLQRNNNLLQERCLFMCLKKALSEVAHNAAFSFRVQTYYLPLTHINSSENTEDNSKWENFVESIKSKLTVKQVVDGVRAGGSLSFDYLLLIVTAE